MQTPISLSYILKNRQEISDRIRKSRYAKLWQFPHSDSCQLYELNRLPDDISTWDKSTKALLQPNKLLKWIDEVLVQTYVVEIVLFITKYLPVLIPPINAFMAKAGFQKKEHAGKSYEVLSIAHGIPWHDEAEYAVPFKYWTEALERISAVDKKVKIDFVQEYRFVKADKLWLSAAYEQDVCMITLMAKHINRREFFTLVQESLLEMEQLYKDCKIRVHWGKKHFLTGAQLHERYPKMQDFKQLRKEMDPNNIFMNSFLERTFQ